MPDLTPLEAAKIIETAYGWQKDKGIPAVDAALFAAAQCRKIDAGELRPVVHAHWKKADGWPGPAECSNCDADAPCDESGNECLSEHCPTCGALMDGKDDRHAEK